MNIKDFIRNNKDKVLHFAVGYAIAIFTIVSLTLAFPEMLVINVFSGLLLSTIAGYCKEYLMDDTVDNYDIIATIAGGILASIVGFILYV